jgi:hypothetical protein
MILFMNNTFFFRYCSCKFASFEIIFHGTCVVCWWSIGNAETCSSCYTHTKDIMLDGRGYEVFIEMQRHNELMFTKMSISRCQHSRRFSKELPTKVPELPFRSHPQLVRKAVRASASIMNPHRLQHPPPSNPPPGKFTIKVAPPRRRVATFPDA